MVCLGRNQRPNIEYSSFLQHPPSPLRSGGIVKGQARARERVTNAGRLVRFGMQNGGEECVWMATNTCDGAKSVGEWENNEGRKSDCSRSIVDLPASARWELGGGKEETKAARLFLGVIKLREGVCW